MVITDKCWLGAGATVIGGVTLGDNVVLAGVPARVIRTFA
ncbi:hypothetical protein [Alkalibacterium thalassium]